MKLKARRIALCILGVYVSGSHDPRTAAFFTHPCFCLCSFWHINLFFVITRCCTLTNKVQSFSCPYLIITSYDRRDRQALWGEWNEETGHWDFSGSAMWPRNTHVFGNTHTFTTTRTAVSGLFCVFSEHRVLLAKAWRTGAKSGWGREKGSEMGMRWEDEGSRGYADGKEVAERWDTAGDAGWAFPLTDAVLKLQGQIVLCVSVW